jgi:hypothetical protein
VLTIYDEFADAVAVPSKRVTVHRSLAAIGPARARLRHGGLGHE